MIYFKMFVIMAIIYVGLNTIYLLRNKQSNLYSVECISSSYKILFITSLPMFAVYVLQYSVHSDYDNYEKMYYQIMAGVDRDVEKIPFYINKVVGWLGCDFQWIYVIFYTISFSILISCIMYYSKNRLLSLLMFGTVFFVLGFVQMRQLVAVLLCFYAYRYIKKENFLKYLLLVILAFFFHRSAIVMIPAYFILRKHFKLSFYIVTAILLGLINLVQYNVINWIVKTFMTSYLGRHEMFRNTIINKWEAIFLIILLLLSFIYQESIKKADDDNSIFLNGFYIYLLLFFFCRWLPEFDRFGYYFYFPTIVLFPNMIASEKAYGQKMFLYITLLLLSIGLFYMRQGDSIVFNYASIFSV